MSSSDRGLVEVGDQAVDVRRYVDALRRGAWLIAAIAIIVTLVVIAVSATLPKTYTASARLVYNPTSSVLAATDAESIERQLATYESLVRAPGVVTTAGKSLSESPSSLKSAISASTNPSANILTISATAGKPALAAARANAVSRAFVSQEQVAQNSGYQTARHQLEAEITGLKASPAASAQIAALESRISDLQISATGTNSELQIAESATIPTSATSPRVALNAVIAVVVALLLGVFITLARDQLRPRFADPRELGDALGLPVLAGIPYRPQISTPQRQRGIAGLEREAYNLLRTAIRPYGQPSDGPRIFLITSATHGEGKTTVTANLARALARSGQKTLAISGDMRSPTLHYHFGVPLSPGLSDCLDADPVFDPATIESAIRVAPGEQNLDVLAAGEMPSDPSSLAWSPALSRVADALRQMDYAYLLIDSPPILGIADTQVLARISDEVLLVARLDRVSRYQAEELGGLLSRLEINPLGLTVVGARVELSQYYLIEQAVSSKL
jgi:succinoglycan biosynthesis transport protein ExoP